MLNGIFESNIYKIGLTIRAYCTMNTAKDCQVLVYTFLVSDGNMYSNKSSSSYRREPIIMKTTFTPADLSGNYAALNAATTPAEELAALSNEALYAALVAETAPLDEGLELLIHHLKPIIINAARGYLRVLSWDLSDALQEARILLWRLVTENRYRPDSHVPFHNFFSKCFSNRLNKLYRDHMLRNPTVCGTFVMGWEAREAVVMTAVKFLAFSGTAIDGDDFHIGLLLSERHSRQTFTQYTSIFQINGKLFLVSFLTLLP